MTRLQDLPEYCIAEILQYTTSTPVDTCMLSFVSKDFHSAAKYDFLWDRFFPSDLFSIIPPSSLPSFESKKALYFALCDGPTIINQGSRSFQLDKRTGKKCFMFSAEDLTIQLGDDDPNVEEIWITWTNLLESRFREVVMLCPTTTLYIFKWIDLCILSPNTEYESFLVFKFIDDSTIEHDPKESVDFFGGAGVIKHTTNDSLLLQERTNTNLRSDGWLEIEIGSFNSGLAKEDQVLMIMESRKNEMYNPASFYLEGIEVRPKHLSSSSMLLGQS